MHFALRTAWAVLDQPKTNVCPVMEHSNWSTADASNAAPSTSTKTQLVTATGATPAACNARAPLNTSAKPAPKASTCTDQHVSRIPVQAPHIPSTTTVVYASYANGAVKCALILTTVLYAQVGSSSTMDGAICSVLLTHSHILILVTRDIDVVTVLLNGRSVLSVPMQSVKDVWRGISWWRMRLFLVHWRARLDFIMN